MKKLEIYVHIPFCISKCKYCDFLSFPCCETEKDDYVQALKREIKGFQNKEEFEVKSIFIGGGTPTILSVDSLDEIVSTIMEEFNVSENAEVSIECNPKTADIRKFKVLKKAGINRLSIGVQAMNDELLVKIGRSHSRADVFECFEFAREAGFNNINADLIFALPGQSLANWDETLKEITALKPTHISAYSLIIEEGTPFYELYHEASVCKFEGKEQKLLPSEENEVEMYDRACRYLKEAGYEQYEISNFAIPGYKCIHNDGYWTRQSYAGFGLGASSFINGRRFENTKDMQEYLESAETIWSLNIDNKRGQFINKRDAMAETMYLGLRRSDGVSEDAFVKEFGKSIREIYGEVIEKQVKLGYLIEEDGNIHFTHEGILISNICLAEYLPD